MVVTTDEIPLNSVNSTNSENQQSSDLTIHGYDSTGDEAERRLLNVTQNPTIDCNSLRVSPKQKSTSNRRHSDETVSLLESQQGTPHLQNNLRDINAMSIASVYDREHNEVDDADNEIYNDVSFSRPNARASREQDSEHELNIDADPEEMGASPIENNHVEKHHPADCESCYAEPPEPLTEITNTQQASLFFADGERSIDFVLVWKSVVDPIHEDLNCTKRAIFEDNLINEGLELERESVDQFHFTKIHTPIEVLRRYAEILKLRMPMKEIPGFQTVQTKTATVLDTFAGIARKLANIIDVDEKNFPLKSTKFTAIYSRDKEYLFDVHHACFFTSAIRSRIVHFILDRKRFTLGEGDDYAFGIDRLIDQGVYIAAYPLHDGEISVRGSVRHLLYTEWASVSKWYRYQPLDYVNEYFGVKIGLYFAWLGFYTYMLLLASVVGFACFLYAVFTLKYDVPSQEVCSGQMNVTMCPLCDKSCNFWSLSMACMHIKVTYLFDNKATVFFAVFMSFWAALFLELWKRYSAKISHRWDLTGFDIHEEHPRPQYLARLAHVKKIRIDYITNTREPSPPFWRMKLPAAVFSFSIVLLLVALAFAAVLAVVLYRMSVLAALSVSTDEFTTSNAIYITTITAALINLLLIFVFSWFYIWLAERLTELEILRTQTEFDDSLTLKIYLFQFVNYYASIFYVAFFKGKFIGRPGAHVRYFGYRQEECGFGGCITELCIQLGIIMVGKQAMNTVLELIQPRIYKYYNSMRVRMRRCAKPDENPGCQQRWVRDLRLVEWGRNCLFNEYLEMVLQYGFVTIFVAAFPLAPFFALLNNILEMRLDAKKLLAFHRRPVTQRVRDIGVWYRILDSISKLSVITNGLIIAFTSEFIPRLVYQYYTATDHTLHGYVNHSLAYFDTKDFGNEAPEFPHNHTVCRYPDYRSAPGTRHEYDKSYYYWIVLAARLGFVLIFENFVAFVMIGVRWAIPDLSGSLRDKIRREAYITNEIIIKQEAERARKCWNERISNGSLEPSTDLLRIEQLMTNNLSTSQLDLVMHGEGDPFAPGHVKPRNYDSKLRQNDSKYSEMFLETEKNGGRLRKTNGAQKNPNQIDINEYDEPTTETSAL